MSTDEWAELRTDILKNNYKGVSDQLSRDQKRTPINLKHVWAALETAATVIKSNNASDLRNTYNGLSQNNYLDT